MAVLVIAGQCVDCSASLPENVTVGRCGPCRLATLPLALRAVVESAPCPICHHAAHFHAEIGEWCARCGRECPPATEEENDTMKAKVRENTQSSSPAREPDAMIHQLRERERVLLDALKLLPQPIERAESVEAALAAIARREQIPREIEAVRATRHELEHQQQEAGARESEIEHVQSVIDELVKRLPVAASLDEREGGQLGRDEQVRSAIARRREELQRLEDGGELGPGQRI